MRGNGHPDRHNRRKVLAPLKAESSLVVLIERKLAHSLSTARFSSRQVVSRQEEVSLVVAPYYPYENPGSQE
jgi:hypothetical protein